jgi:hypothetical protein
MVCTIPAVSALPVNFIFLAIKESLSDIPFNGEFLFTVVVEK